MADTFRPGHVRLRSTACATPSFCSTSMGPSSIPAGSSSPRCATLRARCSGANTRIRSCSRRSAAPGSRRRWRCSRRIASTSSSASTAPTTSRCTTRSSSAPGWRTCCSTLKAQGRRLGLVTAKRRVTVELAFARLPLAGLFEVVVGGDETERHKPSPEPLQLGLERLGVGPAGRRVRRRLAVRHAGRARRRDGRGRRHLGAHPRPRLAP